MKTQGFWSYKHDSTYHRLATTLTTSSLERFKKRYPTCLTKNLQVQGRQVCCRLDDYNISIVTAGLTLALPTIPRSIHVRTTKTTTNNNQIQVDVLARSEIRRGYTQDTNADDKFPNNLVVAQVDSVSITKLRSKKRLQVRVWNSGSVAGKEVTPRGGEDEIG